MSSVLREELRKASLAPQNAPNAMVGQFIGSMLAAVTWAPSGYVRGQGLEEVLSRATHFVDKGLMRQALQELDGGLKGGYTGVLMADWRQAVEERLAVDQSLKIIKAALMLRHKAGR